MALTEAYDPIQFVWANMAEDTVELQFQGTSVQWMFHMKSVLQQNATTIRILKP